MPRKKVAPRTKDSATVPQSDTESVVMEQIISGSVTMKPRWYFWLGSLLSVIGLIGAGVVALFSFNIFLFSLRQHGPMGQWRLEQIVLNFPWWAVVVALISLAFGIWLLHRYDFAYRRNFGHIVIVVIASLVLSAWVLDATGLFGQFARRGPMQRMLRYEHFNDPERPPEWQPRGRQQRLEYSRPSGF
jgi:hypothetical protein